MPKEKNNRSEELVTLKIKNIKPIHWALLSVISILLLVLTWQSILPFLAERNYRDGYHDRALAGQWAKRNNKGAADRAYLQAAKHLEKAVKLAPLETHYKNELGKTYEEISKRKKSKKEKLYYLNLAKEQYEKMIAMNPTNPWFRNRLSGIYQTKSKVLPEEKQKYLDLAETTSRKAASIDSNNPLFQLNLAYFLHREGKLDDAIYYYKRTISIDGRMMEAHFNLADVYRKKKQPDKMIEQYLKIYERAPDFPRTRLAIAQYYIERNKSKEALPFLEEEFQKNKRSKNVMVNLVRIYHEEKAWDKLLPVYDSLFKRYPKTREQYKRFYLQALVNSGQIDIALKEVNERLKSEPQDDTLKKQLDVLNKLKASQKKLQKQ